MAFCAQCGVSMDEGMPFCLQCGTKAGTVPMEVPPVTMPTPPVYQPSAFQQQININQPPQGAAFQQGGYYPPQAAMPPVPPLIAAGWRHYTGTFKKYAVFRGRASMEEFLAAGFINLLVFLVLETLNPALMYYAGLPQYILTVLYFLIAGLPLLGLYVRRMHDIDRSGWYCLVPAYGWFILPLCEGTKGQNKYGFDPKSN